VNNGNIYCVEKMLANYNKIDGRQILYFKLHVDGRKLHYRSPHAAVRPQVAHRCATCSQF